MLDLNRLTYDIFDLLFNNKFKDMNLFKLVLGILILYPIHALPTGKETNILDQLRKKSDVVMNKPSFLPKKTAKSEQEKPDVELNKPSLLPKKTVKSEQEKSDVELNKPSLLPKKIVKSEQEKSDVVLNKPSLVAQKIVKSEKVNLIFQECM